MCVGHRVVPILQCVAIVAGGSKRAYFSYTNLATSNVMVGIGRNNFVTPSGTPNQIFHSGRRFFFPFSSFSVRKLLLTDNISLSN